MCSYIRQHENRSTTSAVRDKCNATNELLLMIINYRDVFSLTKLKGRQQVEYAKGNNDCITFTKGKKKQFIPSCCY